MLKRSGLYQALLKGEASEVDPETILEAIVDHVWDWDRDEDQYLLLLDRIEFEFPCEGFEIAGHSLMWMAEWGILDMAVDPDICRDFFPDEQLPQNGWAIVADGGHRGRLTSTGKL